MKRSATLVVAGLALVCIAAFSQDAATFRGNLAHTGEYQSAGIPALPKIKWKFQTQGRIISSPAVVNGTVYVGSADGFLYAVDSARGALKWKFETNGLVTSSPAVVGGVVYFGSYDGKFYAVDAATGKEKWNFETEGERRFAAKNINGIQPEHEVMPDFWDFYLSSPAVSDGKVFFGSGDGHVYALDAASGKLAWKFKTGNVVHASPAIASGTVFIGSFDGYFYALDASTGAQKWRYRTGVDETIHNQEGITSSAAVVDGMVYFGCRDSHVYFLDAETGRRKWEYFSGGGWISNSPAVHDGKVYFGSGSDKRFQVLDAKKGTSLFSVDIGGGTFASPAITGDIGYLATFNNLLRAIDLKTYKVLWTFHAPTAAANPPAAPAPGGLQPLMFYDDRVAAMSQRLDSGIFLSSPVVVGRVLYIGNTDGALYALE